MWKTIKLNKASVRVILKYEKLYRELLFMTKFLFLLRRKGKKVKAVWKFLLCQSEPDSDSKTI